jgi:hypothetical protein
VCKPLCSGFWCGLGDHGKVGRGDRRTLMYHTHRSEPAHVARAGPVILRVLDGPIGPLLSTTECAPGSWCGDARLPNRRPSMIRRSREPHASPKQRQPAAEARASAIGGAIKASSGSHRVLVEMRLLLNPETPHCRSVSWARRERHCRVSRVHKNLAGRHLQSCCFRDFDSSTTSACSLSF